MLPTILVRVEGECWTTRVQSSLWTLRPGPELGLHLHQSHPWWSILDTRSIKWTSRQDGWGNVNCDMCSQWWTGEKRKKKKDEQLAKVLAWSLYCGYRFTPAKRSAVTCGQGSPVAECIMLLRGSHSAFDLWTSASRIAGLLPVTWTTYSAVRVAGQNPPHGITLRLSHWTTQTSACLHLERES